MTFPDDAVFFIAFQRLRGGTHLKFVEDFTRDDDLDWPATGLFVFLRNENNRGRARRLEFPAIIGFGDNAKEFKVSLRSLYPETRNANRFVCEHSEIASFISGITFSAQKLPEPVRMDGSATMLHGHSLWQLVADDRLNLEHYWRENQFYFLGFGKVQREQ